LSNGSGEQASRKAGSAAEEDDPAFCESRTLAEELQLEFEEHTIFLSPGQPTRVAAPLPHSFVLASTNIPVNYRPIVREADTSGAPWFCRLNPPEIGLARVEGTEPMRVGFRSLGSAVILLGCSCSSGCTKDDPPSVHTTSQFRFIDVSDQQGLPPQILIQDRAGRYMPESMAGGVVIFDCDGDGDLDLYHLRHGTSADRNASERSSRNRLYRQEQPWRFVDITDLSGADDAGYAMGAAAGDIDNDGDLDLYISNLGPDRLLENDGSGVFTDISEASGIDVDGWSSSVLFADVDGDDNLDIYVTRYLELDETILVTNRGGLPEYPAPGQFKGSQDQLLRNNGDGSFVSITIEAGLNRPSRGLGVMAGDLDGDGVLDLYVANDGEPNQAWLGDGSGGFHDAAMEMGLAINIFGQAEAGMGIAHGDVDGDGLEDLIVTHLISESDTLYQNQGQGHFEDVTGARGLAHPTIDFTGFGTLLFDGDNDGDLDLVTSHGRVLRGSTHAMAAGSSHWQPYAEEDHLFLNDGQGRFRIDGKSGFATRVGVSRGLAGGDLDNDGDIDLVITEADGSLRWWENQSEQSSWWLLNVIDPSIERTDLGAVVEFHDGHKLQRRRVGGGGSYLSGSDHRIHLATRNQGERSLKVRWSDGTSENFQVPPHRSISTLRKGEGE